MGPDTSAPVTTATVAAAMPISGARSRPKLTCASRAHAMAVPGPPTKEALPMSSP